MNTLKLNPITYRIADRHETQNVARHMALFFVETDFEYRSSITNIELTIPKFNTALPHKLTITTGRPGLLIGRQGHYIDSLKQHLRTAMKCELEIHIEENIHWDTLVHYDPTDTSDLDLMYDMIMGTDIEELLSTQHELDDIYD